MSFTSSNYGMPSTTSMPRTDPQHQFQDDAIKGSQGATNDAENSTESMMKQIRQTAAAQMKFQMEMGIIQLITKISEALAKLFKAIGEAIKGLA